MRKIPFFILLVMISSMVFAQQYAYKVEIFWDEFEGEAEAVLQYYHDGNMEAIRGNNYKGSSDGNVVVKSAISEAAQVFYIKKAQGMFFNIWILNSLADPEMSGDDDLLMLSNSAAHAVTTNISTGEQFEEKVPANTKGIAFHAGMIVDGQYEARGDMFVKTGMARIKVVNALTGLPLSDVKVSLIDPRINSEMGKGVTDENGIFEQTDLQFGKYRFILNKSKFMTAEYDFPIDQTELPFAGVLAIAPAIDKLRIVLSWGAQPKDLDAHLTGPDPKGGSFHIWYRNMLPVGGKNFLDRDDTKGFGPETMTVYKPAKGKYRYAVHNYSDRNKSGSNRLSFSNAVVQVYNNHQFITSFRPQKGLTGNVWYVFDVDENYNIKKIDTISNVDSDKEVFK